MSEWVAGWMSEQMVWKDEKASGWWLCERVSKRVGGVSEWVGGKVGGSLSLHHPVAARQVPLTVQQEQRAHPERQAGG